MTDKYEILPVDGDEPIGYVSGKVGLDRVLTYAREEFDVETVIVAVDEDGTRKAVS